MGLFGLLGGTRPCGLEHFQGGDRFWGWFGGLRFVLHGKKQPDGNHGFSRCVDRCMSCQHTSRHLQGSRRGEICRHSGARLSSELRKPVLVSQVETFWT